MRTIKRKKKIIKNNIGIIKKSVLLAASLCLYVVAIASPLTNSLEYNKILYSVTANKPVHIQTTLTVDDESGSDNGSSPFATISAALTAATASDIISVTGGADNIHVEHSISITKDITIQGQGQSTTFLQPDLLPFSATERIFFIDADIAVTFQNMTMRYGQKSPGSCVYAALSSASRTINFTDVTFSENDGGTAAVVGYGIGDMSNLDLATQGTFNFTDCVFSDNYRAVRINSANANFTACSFTSNFATGGSQGGAIQTAEYNPGTVTRADITLTNCTFYKNKANTGGAIYSQDGDWTIINCTFNGNEATNSGGGAIHFEETSSLSITNTILFGNIEAFSGAKDFYIQDQPTTDLESDDITIAANNIVEEAVSADPDVTITNSALSNNPNLTVDKCSNGDTTLLIDNTSSAYNAGTSTGAPSTDQCGRSRGATVDIGVYEYCPTITLSTTPTHVTCNGETNGSVDLTVSGGSSPYTHAWDNGAGTNEDPANLAANTYNVTVTDNNGCVENTSIAITEPSAISTSTTPVDAICNGDNNGSINLTVSGGTSPYTYAWDNGAGTNEDPANLVANTYNVTVTDNNGCTKTDNATVGQPVAIALGTSVTNITCNGLTNGSIDLTVTNGSSPFSYNWDNGGGTNQDPNGLGVNTYSVTVTDNDGCTANTNASVTEPTVITTSTTPSNATCNGFTDGSIDLTVNGGTSPYTYAWDNGAGTNEDPANLAANTYNVTVTDNNGCTKTDNGTVGEPTAISLSTTVTNATGNGLSDGSIDLTVSGGSGAYTYSWDNGGGTNQDPTNLSANTYSVTVTDGTGCTANTSATVTEPNALVLSSTETDVTCNGGSDGSIDLTVSGGTFPYTYVWDNGAGTNQDPNNLAANTYNVTVTDNNGCTKTDNRTVGEPTAIAITMSISKQITCTENANVLAIPSGGSGSGYTYQWSANTGNQTTQEATNLAAGTYTVTVTDGTGCSSNNTVTITDISERCRDSLALVDLYNVAGGTNWTTSWNLNNSINTWHGITTNANISVTHIDLSGNNLQGEIPISMNSLSNLQSLKISNNNIIALAFLTPLISQNLTQLHVDNNLLTFDDITKNITVADYQYSPQKTIDSNRSDTVALGDFYYLQAQIDFTVTNNTYEWFKNGSSIGTTTTNQNLLSNLQSSDVGTYTYQVTNATASALTLMSNPIQLNVVDAGSDTTICEGTGSFNLWATPTGGSWSGTGITDASNGTFDPTTAGVGQHLLSYTVNGTTDFRQVTVFPLPSVEAGNNLSLCDGTGDVTLSGYSPSGGTWSGTGITNGSSGIFNTSTAGIGTHTLTYSYTDPNTNCTNTDQITVSVTTGSGVNITQGDTLEICVTGGSTFLTTDILTFIHKL